MTEKRKLQTKTYDEKYKIIKFVEEHPNMTKKNVAGLHNIKPQTLNDILKNREKIIKTVETPANARKGSIKRWRTVSLDDVDTALTIWFRQYSNKPDVRIDTDLLFDKANFFCQMFGYEKSVSNGWIHRFKKRYGIGKIKKADQSADVVIDSGGTTLLSEAEIVDYVINRNQIKDENKSEEKVNELPVPTILEVYHSLDTIMSFALAKGEGPFIEEVSKFKERFEAFITKLPKKQKSIMKKKKTK
ncbi:hypothetical protein Ahia01_000147100 [Argonauta hians]